MIEKHINQSAMPAQTTATGAQITLSNDSVSSAGSVILLNVGINVRNLLVSEGKQQLYFKEMASVEQMFAELDQLKGKVDALVIGVQLKEPVRIAQRIHFIGKDIPVLILTEPEHYEHLKQALKFAPFLSNDVTPWSTGALGRLPDALLETVERIQKKRAYRGSIAEAQKRLSDVRPERPQVTHYLDHLLDYVPIGILNVDVQGLVLSLNRRAGQILMLTEREALGTSLIEIFPLSEREALQNMIAQCVAPVRQRPPEIFKINETTGTLRHVEIMVSSLVDRSGQLGATVILQDVTDRVHAEQERSKVEEALRASEGRYRELVQTMNEALALTDHRHRITFVNDSFCRMFGYSSNEVINRNLLDFVHDDDHEAMHERMSMPVQTDKVQRYETAWLTKDEGKIYTLTSPKQLFDSAKKYVGCLGIFTEITERKKTEEREKKHIMELAHVSRVTTMGEMSSQIAHELAQPLSAITALSTGSLKMMQSETSDHAEIIGSLSDINEQANRAREIVLRLRNFVRNEEMQHNPIELNDLVRSVIHLVNVEARWHNLPAKLELHEPISTILGDRILIEQVILNLVHNAIEAMQQIDRHARKLTIRTSMSDSDSVQVEVFDTGPGIKNTNLKRIFEPFFTTKSDGMGMGLAITRSIVDAHNGFLSARCNKQGGTTFFFTLPVLKEEMP